MSPDPVTLTLTFEPPVDADQIHERLTTLAARLQDDEDGDEETVDVPAWAALEAAREFDWLIQSTGGPESMQEACSPLALVRQRLENMDGEGIDDFTRRQCLQHVYGVADERRMEISDADPLTDTTFRARTAFENALDEDAAEPGDA